MPCTVTTDALQALYPDSDLKYWRPGKGQGRAASDPGPDPDKVLVDFIPTHRVRCRPFGSRVRGFTHTDYVVLESGSPMSWAWTPARVGAQATEVSPAYALDTRGVWHRVNGAPMIVEATEVRLRGGKPESLGLGLVYFIRAGSGNPTAPIKIGYSSDVHRRLSELQTANAEPLELLATTPGTQLTERAYHARFAPARMEAEWFRPVPELIALVNMLRNLAGLTPLESDAP